MPFQPGDSWYGNAKGRTPGSRNKRTQEIIDLLQKRGDKDPLDFLSEVISSTRKPVSEAIAPSVLQGLRAIETKLGLVRERQDEDLEDNANKMIVFGHSLGGDLLISALGEDLVKKIHQHNPEQNMYPVLGDLVVLINPAAEAAKWIHIQRAVWQRIAMNPSERRTAVEHIGAQMFFPPDQAPIVVAVTAARDWPPGGRRETDCFPRSVETMGDEERNRAVLSEGFNYDWATYDLFPLFKGDFRPVADTLERLAIGVDPHGTSRGLRQRKSAINPEASSDCHERL